MRGHQTHSQPGEQPAYRRCRRSLAGVQGDAAYLAADRDRGLGDGLAWLIACPSGRGVTVMVTGVPVHAVTGIPVAATAAGPAVHALDTLARTAPGSMTWTCSRSPPMLARRFSEAEITPPSSLGWAGVACTPSTAPTIVTWPPSTVRIAAKARHPPACELEPVLTPVIPSCPRAALTL